MNKFIKGAIAAGAATLLLLGGAGTFALWNGTASITSATVTSGKLTLTKSGTGSWNTNPAKWVPGDTFKYTDTITVTAVGDNIKANFKVDPGSITSGGAGGTALKNALTIVTTIPGATTTGGTISLVQPDGSYNLTGAGVYTIPVVVTVTFPSLTPVVDNTTQDGAVTLANLGFVVLQTL